MAPHPTARSLDDLSQEDVRRFDAYLSRFARRYRRKHLDPEDLQMEAWRVFCDRRVHDLDQPPTTSRDAHLRHVAHRCVGDGARGLLGKREKAYRHAHRAGTHAELDLLAPDPRPCLPRGVSERDVDDVQALLSFVPAHHALVILSRLAADRVTEALVREADRDRRGGRAFPARSPRETVEALRRLPTAGDPESALARALFLPAHVEDPAGEAVRKYRRALANALKANRGIFDRELGIT